MQAVQAAQETGLAGTGTPQQDADAVARQFKIHMVQDGAAVEVQAQIMELLKRLQKESRMGVLLITHDMGVVSHMADRVLVMYAGQIVEEAEAEELFRHPSHPYTRALLSAIPTTGDSEDRKLSSIPGMVPENYDTISGCRFADRCPYARQECHQRIGLREISKEHTVRCILQL